MNTRHSHSAPEPRPAPDAHPTNHAAPADIPPALAPVIEQIADAVVLRLGSRAKSDPDWGMVSSKHLPVRIHHDIFVKACRRGRIAEARLWRRQWIAPRASVEQWWRAESRAANDPVPADEIDAIYQGNGLIRTAHRSK